MLLTATPVNNSLTDLETLIKYFIRDDARFASLGIPSIREYIKQAQAIDPANLTPEHLFDLMDQVAVRRTRKFVKEHYANELIIGPDGKPTTIKFPQPKVRRIDYDLDADGLALIDAMVYALDDPTDPHAPRRMAGPEPRPEAARCSLGTCRACTPSITTCRSTRSPTPDCFVQGCSSGWSPARRRCSSSWRR